MNKGGTKLLISLLLKKEFFRKSLFLNLETTFQDFMAQSIISAKPKKLIPYLKEVSQFRHLLLTFARRDLKAIYAQTILGILWTALQPLTALAVFTVFFTLLSPVDTGDIPYPLFAFTGLVSWYFFTAMVVRCGNSVVEAQGIITDIYFPKLILPLSKSIVGLVEFGISLLILVVIMLVMGHYPGIEVLTLPVFMLMNLLLGLTIGIWLSALSYRYRDFQHIVPYLVNFGIWLTPVFYPATLIPEKYSYLLYLNPMAGIIEGYRWALLGGPSPSQWFGLSFVGILLFFIAGLSYFRKIENTMVDRI